MNQYTPETDPITRIEDVGNDKCRLVCDECTLNERRRIMDCAALLGYGRGKVSGTFSQFVRLTLLNAVSKIEQRVNDEKQRGKHGNDNRGQDSR